MSTKFQKLSNKIYREYRRKGYSAKTSRKWADATAGKVRREKARRHG